MTAPLELTPARRAALSPATLARIRSGHAVFLALGRAPKRERADLAEAANFFVAAIVEALKRDLRASCRRHDISAFIKTATVLVESGISKAVKV